MSSDRVQGPAASVSKEAFRRACGRFPTGVTIASVTGPDGAPEGLTVSSFAALSLDPPLVLICLGHGASAIDFFRAARHFGLSVLAEDQAAISERFARRGHNRFAGVAWRPGEFGAPLIDGALAAIECAAEQSIRAGDHDILIGRMVRAHVGEGRPLVHYRGRYGKLSE